MEMQKENSAEKRRRKMVSRPVLVRSVKPTGLPTYTKDNNSSSFAPIWKS